MRHPNIFVNLPVKDLGRSVAFFTAMGYTFDQRFTDENATCLVLGENLFAMLLVEPFFSTFTTKGIADSSRVSEVIVSLGCGSREEVDALVRKAAGAGATVAEPKDYGFLYNYGFADPDGHLWELFFMSPEAAEQGPPKE